MNETILVILRMLDEAFERKSWHGSSLRGTIRGLTIDTVTWRPHPDRHNIQEQVLHAAYWKYTVRRRLLGEKRGSFPLSGSNWFRRPSGKQPSEQEWKADVRLLVDMHHALRKCVADLGAEDLYKAADGGSTQVLSLLTGIAAHDLYHAGQIQLLKRLYADAHAGK